MPPQPRKKRAAAAPKSRADNFAPAPAAHVDNPPKAENEHKSPLYILLVFPILLVIASLSLVTFLYLRALDPLYGSIATNIHLDKVVWAGTIAGAFGPVPSPWPTLAIFGGLIAAIPVSSYWTALHTGRLGSPVSGAILTHAAVLFPVVYFGVSLVKRIVVIFEGHSSENSMARFTILPACATSIIGLQAIWGGLLKAYSFGYSDGDILRTLGGVGVALYACSLAFLSASSSGKKDGNGEDSSNSMFSRQLIIPGVVISLLPIVLRRLESPVLPQPLTEPYTHPSFPLRILSSVPSVTGIVVVGESLPSDTWVPGTPEAYPTSLRYLRASHSILGGVWMGDKISTRTKGAAPLLDSEGTPLGDSIYSAFVLQEAVRLVDTNDRAIQSGKERALFIGLGAGVAVTSFARRDIDTTVIEIDPAVYNASRQYFGLPDLGDDKVFLDDARTVISEKRRTALHDGGPTADTYDYVVHDCFSGGGVPAHLFTTQFWEDLKVIMNPDGVVAVNFAGSLSSNPAKAILFTLQKSFGQCRIYHDSPPDQDDLANSFVNLVFFCSPSTKPLSFRSPSEADYAGSHLRALIFDSLQDREIDPKLIRGDVKDGESWVLNDTNNRLTDWQQTGALEHWNVMRGILPEPFWATY
ncbi:hypothetical protein BC834DRAFT_952433 [Gloeopeniophorella convolvens]|nr:hypothetical protein BC834DRAFT_952433 [Gloeopeniophorella convolvens]